MIQVVFSFSGDSICELRVSGHAGSDVKGKDLVCAAVSSVVVGGVNALILLDKSKHLAEIKDAYVNVVLSVSNETNQLIMKTIKVQLESIKEISKNYISIKEERK